MLNRSLHTLRFAEGITPPLKFPLKEIPQNRNKLHSPRLGNPHTTKPFDYTRYEEYLDEVVEVRLRCGKNEYPVDFLARHYPKAWGRIPSKHPTCLESAGIVATNVDSCIEAVRMDTPVDLGLFILRDLNSRQALKSKQGASYTPFLENFPQAISVLSEYVHEALEKCFEVKYFYGVARPGEVYAALKGGDVHDLSAYPFPTHPAYSAGHSAAAGATAQFFHDYFDLEVSDWIEIRTAAYLFGQYRTLAGVHYAVDNLSGLEVGGLNVGQSV